MGEQIGKETEHAESTTVEMPCSLSMQLLLGLRMLGRMNPPPLGRFSEEEHPTADAEGVGGRVENEDLGALGLAIVEQG